MKLLTSIPEGSQFNQILCAFLISLSTFFYGNAIGWMSPMTLLLQSDKSPKGVPLTDLEISWMASLPYIVSVPGTYLMAAIGDRYGRKLALLVVTASAAATWLLKLCSMSIWAFITARVLVGITLSGSCVTCPIYIKEISDSNIRGALGCWTSVCFASGALFAYIIGDAFSYWVSLIILMVLPIVHFIIFLMMPESPSYLIKIGKLEGASKSLLWLRCRSKYDLTIKEEIDYIKEEHEKDEGQGPFLLMEILSSNILRRAFYISLVVTLSRELCGLVQVTTFAGDIFQLTIAQSVIKLSPNQKAIVTGFVQLCGVILASVLIERCGRKPLIFVTSFISGLSMCVLATWFLLQHFNPPGYIPVITLCVCIFCDNSGTLPLSLVLTGEMFSFKYRGTVLAMTMSIACTVNFIQLLFFKSIIKIIGIYIAFYFFGAVCLLTAMYVIIMLPETRNRKLEDIYYDLSTSKDKMEVGHRASTSQR